MGVANSTDIFQQKMNNLFHGFEFICAYIDVLLILTKRYLTYTVQKLELTLIRMKEKDLNLILKILSSEKPKGDIWVYG